MKYDDNGKVIIPDKIMRNRATLESVAKLCKEDIGEEALSYNAVAHAVEAFKHCHVYGFNYEC